MVNPKIEDIGLILKAKRFFFKLYFLIVTHQVVIMALWLMFAMIYFILLIVMVGKFDINNPDTYSVVALTLTFIVLGVASIARASFNYANTKKGGSEERKILEWQSKKLIYSSILFLFGTISFVIGFLIWMDTSGPTDISNILKSVFGQEIVNFLELLLGVFFVLLGVLWIMLSSYTCFTALFIIKREFELDFKDKYLINKK